MNHFRKILSSAAVITALAPVALLSGVQSAAAKTQPTQCIFNAGSFTIDVNWVRLDAYANPMIIKGKPPNSPDRQVSLHEKWKTFKGLTDDHDDMVLEHRVKPGQASCHDLEPRTLVIFDDINKVAKMSVTVGTAALMSTIPATGIVAKAAKAAVAKGTGTGLQMLVDKSLQSGNPIEGNLTFNSPKGAAAMHMNVPVGRWAVYSFKNGKGSIIRTPPHPIESRTAKPFCLQTKRSHHFVNFNADHRTMRLRAQGTKCDRANKFYMTDLNGESIESGDYVTLYRAEDWRRGLPSFVKSTIQPHWAPTYVNIEESGKYVVHEGKKNSDQTYSNAYGEFTKPGNTSAHYGWGSGAYRDGFELVGAGQEVFQIFFEKGTKTFGEGAGVSFKHVKTKKWLTAYDGGGGMIDPTKSKGVGSVFEVRETAKISGTRYSAKKQLTNSPLVCLKNGSRYLSAQTNKTAVSSVKHCRAAEKFRMVDLNGGFCIKHNDVVRLKTNQGWHVGIDSGHKVYVWNREGNWERFQVHIANSKKRKKKGYCVQNGDWIGLQSLEARNSSRNNNERTFIAMNSKNGKIYGHTNKMSKWETFGVLFK